MYRYDEYDQAIVDQRVGEFRDQTRRYLAGELQEEEFKALRLMNGLYIQRYAPMLRVAIPYGVLSGRQMRKLAEIARRFDSGYGHFTTRQNIQFNWPQLEQVPDILAELASVQMHAIQTSGNCVRNVTTDPLAGIAADELDDPRPWAEILRQWSSFHPEFIFLPRKFKIAVNGAATDRAAVAFHDIGLHLKRRDGELGFEVMAGGGQGRTPQVGETIREFLPAPDLLSYIESILRVYNLRGRRDNKHKARIKILLRSLGRDRFAQLVEDDWNASDRESLRLDPETIERMRAHFRTPFADDAPQPDSALEPSDPAFARWLEHNTAAGRFPNRRAVFVYLKGPGRGPGDLGADEMETVADLAERFSHDEIRTTHDQNLVLPYVPDVHLETVWKALRSLSLAQPRIGTAADLICCPGFDYCSLANATSIDVAADIRDRFDDLDYLYDLGPLQIKISGCMNACGHHHVGHIGILGVDKKGEHWYQITIGGSASNDAAIGRRIGPSVPKQAVADAVERLIDVYLRHRHDGETFLATVRRIGTDPFSEGVYEQQHAA
jgi:sulfite reductase (NADPH) hemoprotein beta-component